MLSIGAKVKVSGLNEVGEIVGYYDNDFYIVLWDEIPTVSDNTLAPEQRAIVIFYGCMEEV